MKVRSGILRGEGLGLDGGWVWFQRPVRSVTAGSPEEVGPLLDEVDAAVASGLWAVGMVSFDAAPGFDSALAAKRHHRAPLATFSFYPEADVLDRLPAGDGFALGQWSADTLQPTFAAAVHRIREHIERGEAYQINHTYRMTAPFFGDPLGLFGALARAQPTRHSAYLDLGGASICSASPELFFERNGADLTCRPMKGTSRRGATTMQDQAAVAYLQETAKELAENTMIVDMVRNDLGRIAEYGTVTVSDLHRVETLPTVHQMTSTVTATSTTAQLLDVFSALFPPASITGAPKVAACKIISQLETGPRGAYTGTIGAISPDGRASFNVAIRTAWVDRTANTVEYGVGGGILWDSVCEQEWQETLDKALLLSRVKPSIQLLETMRWDPGYGIFLEGRHLARLHASAGHFGYPIDLAAIRERLAAIDGTDALKVRLRSDAAGDITLQQYPLTTPSDEPLRLAVDSEPGRSTDIFARHKTTERSRYLAAGNRFPDFDDVVLWNEREEITETTVGNLVLKLDQRLLTPASSSGLLPGTLRAELLDHETITEQVLTMDDLRAADSIWVINSVTGWRPAVVDEMRIR